MVGAYESDRDRVTFSVGGGDHVHVDIARDSDDFRPVRGSGPLGRLDEVFEPVRHIADALVRQVRGGHAQPDEVTVSFGITVGGSGQSVVTRAGTNGTFAVTLTWRPSNEPPSAGV